MNFEHYSIRILQDGDLDGFYDLIDRNRPRLEAFFAGTVAKTKTFPEAENYFSEVLSRIEKKTYLPHFIIDNSDHSFIGFVDLKNIDWNIPKAETGLFIDQKYENKNISTKAFGVFVAYCFDTLGFKKLFLRTHPSNIAAKRLAEKCGFQVEGIIRRDYKTTEGELVDLIYYGKLPED